jgi:hypothetical protein
MAMVKKQRRREREREREGERRGEKRATQNPFVFRLCRFGRYETKDSQGRDRRQMQCDCDMNAH